MKTAVAYTYFYRNLPSKLCIEWIVYIASYVDKLNDVKEYFWNIHFVHWVPSCIFVNRVEIRSISNFFQCQEIGIKKLAVKQIEILVLSLSIPSCRRCQLICQSETRRLFVKRSCF